MSTPAVSFSEELDAAIPTPEPEPEVETPAETAPSESAPSEEPVPSEAPAEEAPAESVPAEEPAPSEPEVDDAADAALALSPEELAEIKANPATAKLYKSLMRASTSKFQEISANKRILQAMRDNPRAVIESAAKNLGLTVSEAKDPAAEERQAEVVDDVMSDMVNLFGPELAPAVRPVMERLVKSLVDKEVAPIREQRDADKVAAQQASAKSVAETFRAKHKGEITPEVEARIMELGKKTFPAEGTDPVEYLDMLFTLATAGNTARATAKVAAERIKAAQDNVEPRRGAPTPAPASIITEDMSLDQAFDAAWAAAKASR